MDHIVKPVERMELLSRLQAAVECKRKMDSRKRAYKELENMLLEWQYALANVKSLLPIGSLCKMIRDDQGYWD